MKRWTRAEWVTLYIAIAVVAAAVIAIALVRQP